VALLLGTTELLETTERLLLEEACGVLLKTVEDLEAALLETAELLKTVELLLLETVEDLLEDAWGVLLGAIDEELETVRLL
jgi:predicted nucleic acid-binding protein